MKKIAILFSLFFLLTGCTTNQTQPNEKVPEQTDPDSGQNHFSEEIPAPYQYSNDSVQIQIQPYEKRNVRYWISTIKVLNAEQLKSAFSNETISLQKEKTSKIAGKNGAILAVNGADVAFKSRSLVIRNGEMYRESFSPLEIRKDGTLFIGEGDRTAEDMKKDGVLHSFDFGPELIVDGKRSPYYEEAWYSDKPAPRTAIGQRTPHEYIIITVDGRSKESRGMTFRDLTALFEELGAKWAYNLDGGGSTTLYFNGEVLNTPSDGSERPVSDILYVEK
ncbi:phosphodiester glycosidase family protein [Bacillus massiliglaciei]|uniref:phosphodiester glycosidase family protein n=1 Tax=Bacillus massiliglaciei TaxID=1816693 RepID=UPI000DA6232F|nr:phosphodiester glycosidase family protein [Bacillus massiliglaciei]